MKSNTPAAKAKKSSNKLTDSDMRHRFQAGCPHCGGKLVSRERWVNDRETGNSKFGGSFFGCSNFGRGCTANYSLSLCGREIWGA